MVANEKPKPRRGWVKGKSGNPAGRPKGSRNKATLAAEKLLDGEIGTITRKLVKLAKGGDMVAMKLFMDRAVSPRKDRPIRFPLPELKTTDDAVKASAAIARGMSRGELTPGEAAELSKVIESFTNATAARDLEQRLARLEGHK